MTTQHEASAWPEWLTPEFTAMHAAISQQMIKALEHCYASADADGSSWSTEGWISVSASNILSLLKSNGNPPPNVGEPPERPLTVHDVAQRWLEEIDGVECPLCNGVGMVEAAP